MQSTFRSAIARRSFASVKEGSQSVRDNNAAWVAGPSRICFLTIKVMCTAGGPPAIVASTFRDDEDSIE
jgi:hypothetical protein